MLVLIPLFETFMRSPAAILKDFLNLKPIFSHPREVWQTNPKMYGVEFAYLQNG